MIYSHWEKDDNIKNHLVKTDYKSAVEGSGIPILYEGDSVYTTKKSESTIVIGANGSGKTQTIILPLTKFSMLANESLVINDPKGEIYENTANEFKSRGYNVIVIDLDETKYGNYFNPITLAQKLYNEGNMDKCITIIEQIGYYLFYTEKKESDPFWTNSASDYFTGLCLYLFEKSKEEVTIKDVFNLANKLIDDKECSDFLNEIGKENPAFYSVSGTLTSPRETRGGIVSVFNQKLKRFVSRDNLSKMMSKTDFDISSISKNKTVIFIKSAYYDYSISLTSLFINEMYEAINIYGNSEKKVNIIIDEFDSLIAIKNFPEMVNYARSIGVAFTCCIQSVTNLANTYGKENTALMKLCFANIVYLYSNDINTMERVSELCGYEAENKPLISTEELKMLEPYEAIVLIPRMMPYKTKLALDYKINWGIDFNKAEFLLRK